MTETVEKEGLVLVPREWLRKFDRGQDPNEAVADSGETVWDLFCFEAGRYLSAPRPPVGEGLGASASPIPTEQAGGPVVGWQPIETAPRDGESILAICATAYSPVAGVTWWQDGWTHYSRPAEKWHGGVGKWFPTHWMPLPAAPSTTSTAEQVERLCPCGKPSLPTASVCSGCADACAADGGEGDAPVAWQARIKPDGEWFHVSEPYAERRRAEAGIEMRPLFTRPTPATILTLLEDRQKMVEALEQIASRARSEVWPDHYAPEPPEWALDEHNEASTCGYCNAWLTVVRPGKSQCDCCADGQDLGAIARATLSALEETNR